MTERLGILTLNIGSPSAKRAERQLEWLSGREEDVLVLTETCGTAGTRLIAERLSGAGWDVRLPALGAGERGVLLAFRVRAGGRSGNTTAFLPARAEAARIAGPSIDLIGVYVPSRDESLARIERKRRFVDELLKAVRGRRCAVLIGDLNILEPDHRPRYAFFRDWEYDLYRDLTTSGWVDAYRLASPERIEHSWVSPDGDGFRFDHIFVSGDLREAVRSCTMVHETRETGLTDHSAIALDLWCAQFERVQVEASLSADPLALF